MTNEECAHQIAMLLAETEAGPITFIGHPVHDGSGPMFHVNLRMCRGSIKYHDPWAMSTQPTDIRKSHYTMGLLERSGQLPALGELMRPNRTPAERQISRLEWIQEAIDAAVIYLNYATDEVLRTTRPSRSISDFNNPASVSVTEELLSSYRLRDKRVS